MLSIDNSIQKPVTVLYNGKSVNSINAVIVTIRNSGNKPIEADKFAKEISINFEEEVAATPDVIYKKPEQIEPTIKLIDNVVFISPLLLNEDDSFSFRVLLINSKEHILIPKIGGRITGISQINIKNVPKNDQENIYPKLISGYLEKYAITFTLILAAITGLLTLFSELKKYYDTRKSLVHIKESPYTEWHKQTNVNDIEINLKIGDHGRKSTMFLIRLKIESLLNDLSKKYLHTTFNKPIRFITDRLVAHDIIKRKTASAIYDITPILNKEIHNNDSYITDDDFDRIKKMALTIIDGLETLLAKK